MKTKTYITRKRLVKIVCVVLVLALSCGMAAFAQEISAPETPQQSAQAVKQGDRGDAVATLQKRLYELGYLSTPADGAYGPKTQSAVALFQKGAGLPENGEADDATQKRLYAQDALRADEAFPRELAAGDKGADVRRLQQRLIDYGLMDGAADGSFGKVTAAAVDRLEAIFEHQARPDSLRDGRVSPAEQAAFYGNDFNPYLHDLREGDQDVFARCVEARLRTLNYTDTEPDETLDAHSIAALRLFQTAQHLPVTGVVDQATTAKLFSPATTAAKLAIRRDIAAGDSGRTVREMEDMLARYGFMDTLADDDYDDQTQRALNRLRAHAQTLGEYGETWLNALEDNGASAIFQTMLLTVPFETYIAEAADGEQLRRVQRRLFSLYYLGNGFIDGKNGSATTAAVTAFQQENGLPATGLIDRATQDALFSGEARTNPMPYLVEVSLSEQRVRVYARSATGAYALTREMICSTGLVNGSTPKGVFVRTKPQDRWHYFQKFFCWAQYTYIISGDIMFHSVLFSSRNERSLRESSLYNLGHRASHGCVRLAVDDAKWLFENCGAGTPVVVR